jgi:hypothetical protein
MNKAYRRTSNELYQDKELHMQPSCPLHSLLPWHTWQQQQQQHGEGNQEMAERNRPATGLHA